MSWLFSLLPTVLKFGMKMLTGAQNVDLEKYRIRGEVSMEAMRQDTEIIKARADLAKAMANDPTTRWGRRLFIYPTGLYYILVLYDSCARMALGEEYTWRILALPPELLYIPYAVVAYLFVTAWRR